MNAHTYIPAAPLNEYVEFLFFYEDFNPAHQVDRFLPDGNTELIIDLTDTPKYIYDNETLQEKQACRNGWISGVRSAPICIPSGKESRMLVITFRKGKAWFFYPMPMHEITDNVVHADLILGNRFLELRERLLEARSPFRMFLLVENYLLNLLRQKRTHSTTTSCISYVVQAILDTPHTTKLSLVNRQIGYSQKHIVHLFKKQVGMTPKEYLRVTRFQKIIRDIEMQKSVNWLDLAIGGGYYDQSHFIHDFRHFSGFTPEEYLRKKTSEFLNYVPVA